MSEDKKEVKQVVKGRVKEKGLGEKAAEAFFSEDSKTVGNYIIWDLLVPGLKNALMSILEMALFGSTRGTRRSTFSSGGRSHVSYGGYYDDSRTSSGRNRVDLSGSSAKYDFSDILLDTRGDAEEVITSMEELVSRYGEASVADLCSLVGVSQRHTDTKWGWRDIRDFSYRRASRGYILDFASPIYLD